MYAKLSLGPLLFKGTNFKRIWKIVDLAVINFSDFTTNSIFSCAMNCNISGSNFFPKMGQFANFAKITVYPQTIVSL